MCTSCHSTWCCCCCCWCCAGPLFSQLASLRSFIRELRPLLGSAGTAAALTAADDLQAVGQLLVAWGVHKEQLLLEPLLTPQAEYFSGALFQVGDIFQVGGFDGVPVDLCLSALSKLQSTLLRVVCETWV